MRRWLAVLTLVAVPALAHAEGWLLMVPPHTNTRAFGTAFVPDNPPAPTLPDERAQWKVYEEAVLRQLGDDLAAPLMRWTQYRAVDSAPACEALRRNALSRSIGVLVDVSLEALADSTGRGREETTWDVINLQVHTQQERWRASQCLPASRMPLR